MMQVDKFLELRGTTSSEKALKIVQELRDTQNVFFMVDDLFHLRRGGRLSAAKAVIGALLGIKPILVINKYGKLAIFDKTRGAKAAAWFLAAAAKYATVPDKIGTSKTTASEVYATVLKGLREEYPDTKIKEAQVGPIIGAHVGGGTFGFCFVGKPRLDV